MVDNIETRREQLGGGGGGFEGEKVWFSLSRAHDLQHQN